MEKLASDLKMSEKKQSSLGKAYESLHSQASSIVLFALQWKDLEDHFDSTRNSLQTRFVELENRQKEIDDREKRLEALGLGFNFDSEMASNTEVESGNHQLRSLKLLIEERNAELDVKEKRLLEVERLVGEKETECDSIDKRIKLLRSREVEPDFCEDIESKERELNEITGSIEERKKVYDLSEEQIKLAQRVIEECDNKVKLKKEELERLNVECSNKLEARENIIMEMELKAKDFYLLKKSMEEWSCKLASKERELQGWFEKLEMKDKQFESKLEELHLIDKKVNEWEVGLKQKHFDSLEKSIQEREKHLDSISHGLQMKERQLEPQAKNLETKQKQFDLIRKSTVGGPKKRILKKKTNILDSEVKIAQLVHTPANNSSVPSVTSIQSRINRNGRDLQLFLNEHLKRHDLVGTEISAILQASSDPAKLVLDAIQGFYPTNSVLGNEECDFDLSVVRRSCILLLQELKRVSPQVNPQVREEAMKLAGDWKDKMMVAAENWLEGLGFLLLLTTYDLTSTYDENELQSLLVVVGQHTQATELCRPLVLSAKAPESSIISSHVKNGEPESSPAKNGATSSSPNFQPSATTDARNFQGLLVEHLNGNHSMQKETLAVLQMSSDPAKLVLDVMQTSFAQYWGKEDVGFEETFMSGIIALLVELMRVSPHVGPHVKEDAIKLAVQWKAKVRVNIENSLESLGFLQFVAAYGLLSTVNGDEKGKFLGMIYQNKQVLELCQKLGLADKIPVEFIQHLIERKQLFEAVICICTFKVIDKFPPAPLLKEYVVSARKSYRAAWRKKKSLNEKEKVVDDQIADLKAVIQCIKDYNLESEYPSKDIKRQIVELEKVKDNWRRSTPFVAVKVNDELSVASKIKDELSLSSKVINGEPESLVAKNGAASSPNLQPSAIADARNLHGFLIAYSNGNHSIQKEMLAVLQISPDPAKLVLDVMQTSFPQYWGEGDVAFKETSMSSRIALLEELMRVSPHVGPHVKEDAIRLAVQWKAKLRADTENSLEGLGFLQFVAAYGLLSTLKRDAVKQLVGMIYQHKQALDLCQTCGLVDKIPDFIQNLIEKKQLLEAVGFICIFNVSAKFPPAPLLKEYVDGARMSYRATKKGKSLDEKEKAVDDRIADLRAVIQCIKDYNLESEYPSKDIEVQIVQLKKMKENWRRSTPFVASKAKEEPSVASKAKAEPSVASKGEEEQKLEKKRSTSTSASEFQQQRKNKWHRTSESAVTPHALPTFSPGYPRPTSSTWVNGSYGGRFANFGAMPNAGIQQPYLFLPNPPIYWHPPT